MSLIIRQKIREKMSNLKAGALFMKRGSKKIDLALDLAKSLQKKVDVVVWIAPSAFLLSKSYRAQIRRYSKGLLLRTFFFSIESISSSDMKFLQLYNLIDKYRSFCVVDESITIKNTEAGRTRRLLGLWNKFRYRLILSGLPLTQGLIDLYSQIKFIDPAILKMTETQFSNVFLPFYEEDDYRRRWSTPENELKLIELMKPFILACDLYMKCEIRYFDQDFELTVAEERNYHDEKEEFLKDKTQIGFLEVVQRFQHIYTIAKSKVDGLFLLVKTIVSKNEKVIIYIKFLDEIAFFRESGGFTSCPFVVMTGNSNKRKVIEHFKNDVNVMFCTYGVSNIGLNLYFCNNIVFFTQTFDYKNKIQSLYNVCREGQKKEINIYNFWLNTGLDRLMKKSLINKQLVLENVCNIMASREIFKI